MTELHRAARRYAHDGKLIDLLGGLHAAIDRLDGLLERHAPAVSGEPCALPVAAGSREWTDALLGAIAIRDHVAQALLVAAVAVAAAPVAAPEPESLRPGREQES
ncbi:MAG: hypothetical protein ACRDMZ_06105, partial [Solirubrobacteraceae bacterium]